jgi:hypothetical protein
MVVVVVDDDVVVIVVVGRCLIFSCGPVAAAPAFGGGSFAGAAPNARREGDWDCASCSGHNYASRTECFKCKTAKPQ